MAELMIDKARFQNYRMEFQDAKAETFISTQEFAFEQLFTTHFKKLYAYAYTIVKEEMTAEEMVQNVFYRIWEKKGKVDIQTSVTAYLYRSVYHESLNYLKHLKVRSAYQAHAIRVSKDETDNAASKLQVSELQKKIDIALSELPEQCRTIFQMSRFEEMKYQQIADKLGLSVKTVENQMGKALKLLRVKLADYLPFVLALIYETANSQNLC